jgi:hypothetical protein
MRHILVDYARAGHCAKRGGGIRRVDVKEALVVSTELGPELLRMDEALNELAQFDSRKARVVEMRYFGGLRTNEIASGSWYLATERQPGLESGESLACSGNDPTERNEGSTRRTHRVEMNSR